jgi:hypothetical protein
MVLDADARVVLINAFLKSMLSLPPSGYKGRLFGHALRCASAKGTNSSCGDMPACANCFLRRSIMGALADDQPVQCATLRHTYIAGGVPVAKALRFSVNAVNLKQGKYALVSLTDMTREMQYESMLARELDMEASLDIIDPHNLAGVVTGLMQKAGPDCIASVGIAALEGMDLPKARGAMTQDETMRRFVEICRQCTRNQDVIARIGDASYVFIFSGVGAHIAAAITRRIHNTMAAVFGAYGASGISFSAGFMELRMPDLAILTSAEIICTAENQLNAARRRGGSLFLCRDLAVGLRD